MPKHSLLADLIDLQDQLRHDHQTLRQDLKQRDRQVGIDIQVGVRTDQSALRRWIRQVGKDSDSPGVNSQRAVTILISVLWLAGIAVGWALASAVLDYDGSEPVNVVSTLVILVGSQLMTLLILIIVTLGGLSGLLNTLSIFNPAAILSRILRWLLPEQRSTLSNLLSDTSEFPIKLRLPLLSYLAQHFSVALNVGMITVLLYLVTVSDIAFGWNSTLQISNQSMAKAFRLIALPWESFLPAAVPGAELIDISRFYRLQPSLGTAGNTADQLGTWWLYILMCLIVYGLVPRILALAVYGNLYDRTVSRALLGSPGANQVLARMRSPFVSTVSPQSNRDHEEQSPNNFLKARPLGRALPCILIEWAEASVPKEVLEKSNFKINGVYTAGGRQSTSEDRKIITETASHSSEGVVITTKSWEPPLLELVDFIEQLRRHISKQTPIVVLLLPLADGTVTAEQLEGWDRQLAHLADPALYVESI